MIWQTWGLLATSCMATAQNISEVSAILRYQQSPNTLLVRRLGYATHHQTPGRQGSHRLRVGISTCCPTQRRDYVKIRRLDCYATIIDAVGTDALVFSKTFQDLLIVVGRR